MSRNTLERAAMLQQRRNAQRSREPGFTPVSNRRIDARFAQFVTQFLPTSMSMENAQDRAWNPISRSLPPQRFERRRLAPLVG